MTYSVAYDGAAGVILIFYLIFGVGAFIMATFVESMVLWQLKWGSFLHSLVTSFIMNLISTIVGFFLGVYADVGLGVGQFILLFIISVAIEGSIMLGMGASHRTTRDVFRVATFANLVSYILLAIGLGLLL